MEREDKAQRSAEVIAIMAQFIVDTLTLDLPSRQTQAILNVPLKQLKDEVDTLSAYIDALQ